MKRRDFIKNTAIGSVGAFPLVYAASALAKDSTPHTPSFLEYVKYIAPEFRLTEQHKQIINAMESSDRLIVNTPPKFGKTWLNQLYASYLMGADNDVSNIGYVTYNYDLARQCVRDIWEIVDSHSWKGYFGSNIAAAADKYCFVMETAEQISAPDRRLIGKGAGGPLSMRIFDLILVDDPANPSRYCANNLYWLWLEASVIPSLQINGRLCLTQSRIGQTDLTGMLLDHGWPDEHIVVPFSDVQDFYDGFDYRKLSSNPDMSGPVYYQLPKE